MRVKQRHDRSDGQCDALAKPSKPPIKVFSQLCIFPRVGTQSLAMNANSAQVPSGAFHATRSPAERIGAARPPLCFVIDGEASTRHFLSLILQGAGIDTEEFSDGQNLTAALNRRTPDVVFLSIPLESAEAIDSVVKLGKRGYSGYVQLMSSRGSAVLAHVKGIGDQHRLLMLPALKKPFETGAVVKILQDIKLGQPPTVAGRLDLEEALRSGWIEFWYQPKIDLRKKQLVGAEAFARARHPHHGVLMPSAFMPGATEAALIALSEYALDQALKASLNFAKLGISLRMAANVPVNALVKLPVPDIVQSYSTKFDKWPGFIIDVTEEQIVTDLALASDMAKKLAPLNVKLAIDDFGRGYSSLVRLKELPFAELKLDRAFVTDCGTDKVNAPLCKTVIDLAHNFGSVAVAIGIEKASDAMALVSMGCDYGQGFLLGQPMPEERFISLLRQRAGAQPRNPAAAAPAPEQQPA
jgi:EAL domain-containing protein (putative c-di-GMP-specific phosphodiesterase class I)/CheY-like chemotaxis protein